jgi:hypothetical protein
VRYDNKQNSQRRKRITLENEKRTKQTTYYKTISPIWKKKERKVPIFPACKDEQESTIDKKRKEKEKIYKKMNKEMINISIRN